ncbi:hypothetical protein [Paludisphaera mucosa]|uniref:Uncharacterized protein n=1 Tax=Paludisphaera mucosa TaxID=3030827 RepID=A0ABT6FLN1_9BACT|nr:hypothetical protein [Paludisphaera mucosa]MDG3008476.1 hypothetical protein [Paludisphaera mucosa]
MKASEIGSYAYCPEAWRLGDGLRLPSSNAANLRRGEESHVETARFVLWIRWASRAGWSLLVVAGFILLALALVAYLLGAKG